METNEMECGWRGELSKSTQCEMKCKIVFLSLLRTISRHDISLLVCVKALAQFRNSMEKFCALNQSLISIL